MAAPSVFASCSRFVLNREVSKMFFTSIISALLSGFLPFILELIFGLFLGGGTTT